MGDNIIDEFRERLADTPYDLELWAAALKEAQNRPVDRVRDLYELLINYYPTSGKFWKIFIEHEMRAKNFAHVEKLFQKCLVQVLNMDLWRCYITYIKEAKSTLPTYKEKLAQAYDFALEKIGMDSVAAPGAYAENQKITAVRKVYQNAIVTPMFNIETLWKEYMNYEQGINKNLSEKIIIDRSKDYMNARRVAKELEIMTKGLNKNAPAVPPMGTQEEMKQTELWKKYISWEKNNPLMTEDQALLTKRVMFAYEQCLLCLWHHPDVWYEAASFLESASRVLHEKGDAKAGISLSREAGRMFERAVQGPMNKNLLLYFTYADFEESRKNYENAHGIYNRVLESRESERHDPSLAYIQCMRFARRAEGIKAARAIFKKVREDERVSYHVYVASALMEYYGSKDTSIALRIFDLGLRKFPSVPGYILAYLDFLLHLNDNEATRQFFVKILDDPELPVAVRKDIVWKFIDFERNVGTLAEIDGAEGRLSKATVETHPGSIPRKAELLIDRYRCHGLYPCSPLELKTMGYHGTSSSDRRGGELLETENEKNEIPLPDVSQMRPFKPEFHWSARTHSVHDAVLDVPPVAGDFCKNLPPWHCFPPIAVDVEKLTKFISETIFHPVRKPLNLRKDSATPVTVTPRLFDVVRKVNWDWSAVLEKSGKGEAEDVDASKEGGRNARRQPLGKRRTARIVQNADSDDEENANVAPPSTDVYRQRQQRRISGKERKKKLTLTFSLSTGWQPPKMYEAGPRDIRHTLTPILPPACTFTPVETSRPLKVDEKYPECMDVVADFYRRPPQELVKGNIINLTPEAVGFPDFRDVPEIEYDEVEEPVKVEGNNRALSRGKNMPGRIVNVTELIVSRAMRTAHRWRHCPQSFCVMELKKQCKGSSGASPDG
ncbi:unnamed protein product [Notodromas monacha]|uniref:Suppressor of forked domain-containing protein n=1 Tax=Notodromas monacha TaxID=399045 RepID=A0A7R9G8D7_9CRUS|nr:unnamed protein product [Notodromas monacha]CAG0913045.1 unnamed protein product [Notodromas monacha]